MAYEITDDMFGRSVVTVDDETAAGMEWPYAPGESVGTKFDNVGAAVAWHWTLDSGQDEESGDAQYGNGWHALFRDERVIVQTVNSGAVYGWRVPADQDIDAVWAEIESGAVYPDDDDETE